MTNLSKPFLASLALVGSLLTTTAAPTYGLLAVAGSVLSVLPSTSHATPPPWAPAHGWRRKNEAGYTGYTGTKWERDYGLINGRCDRRAVAAAIGPSAGTVFSANTGQGKVAVIAGAIIDAVIGSKVGASPDPIDRSCLAQALELGLGANSDPLAARQWRERAKTATQQPGSGSADQPRGDQRVEPRRTKP